MLTRYKRDFGMISASTAASGTIGVPANSTVMAIGCNPSRATQGGSNFDGKIYSADVIVYTGNLVLDGNEISIATLSQIQDNGITKNVYGK